MSALPPGIRRVWLDEDGEPFTAPAHAVTGTDRHGRTHYLFAPFDPRATLHPLTLCGTKAPEIPGAGRVDCRECHEAQEVQ